MIIDGESPMSEHTQPVKDSHNETTDLKTEGKSQDKSKETVLPTIVELPNPRVWLLSVGQKIILYSLLAGLLGGAVGSYAFIKYFASSIPTDRRQTLIQQSSAIIDVAKKVSPSVVSITSKQFTQGYFGSVQQQEGAGTGVIISADGLILTNKHVVPEGTTTVTVVLASGKQYTNARVVSRDPLNDIAFVKIDATELPVAKLGDSSQVVVGEGVVAIGNALGQFQNSVTQGIISGIGRPITAGGDGSGSSSEELQNLFQTDAAINPGNSGGPLVNLDGEIIGMNTAVAGQGSQNIGFAIPINEVTPLIAGVKSSGRIIRPYIGVRYVLLTPEIVTANNLKVTDGALLTGNAQIPAIIAGGPADKAGLKDGDIIIKIDGKSVDTNNTPQSLIASRKVGDFVELTIIRDGKTIAVKVVLQEAPAST
jgi:serine protease Do